MPMIATSSDGPDYPVHACPKCGAEQLDMDGFGLLACPTCGLCTHSSATSNAAREMVCDACGAVVGKARSLDGRVRRTIEAGGGIGGEFVPADGLCDGAGI